MATRAPTIADSIAAMQPALTRRAVKMTGDQDQGEELAAATILRALDKQHQFQAGTNLSAWCGIIMRHAYFNSFRRRKFYGGRVEDLGESAFAAPESQSAYIELQQTLAAIDRLPVKLRDAILQAASGADSIEAAEALHVPRATFRTRLMRARQALAELLA